MYSFYLYFQCRYKLIYFSQFLQYYGVLSFIDFLIAEEVETQYCNMVCSMQQKFLKFKFK